MIQRTAAELVASGCAGCGAFVAGAFAALYYAHSPGGWVVVKPLLRWRSHGNLLAVLLVLAAIASAPRAKAVAPAAAICLALVGVQAWRQKLWSGRAARLRPVAQVPPDDAIIVVLSDGRGVPLAEMARHRVVTLPDGTVLVWCRLARALTAVQGPPGATWRAGLPLASGFEVACGADRYDGVDGTALSGGPSLPLLAVALLPASRWVQLFGTPVLLAARHRGGVWDAPPRRPRWLDPADKTAMDWGYAVDRRWQPLPDTPAAWPTADAADAPRHYLARWAAHARQMGGTALQVDSDG